GFLLIPNILLVHSFLISSHADPSLFLRTDASLPPFYVLVYVDDLVFATADTEALTHVKSELQKRHTCTDLAPPSDESVEPSGPYPELVGCLMYLMTCTRPVLAYPLSLLARYVAPGRHRKVHRDAAKRVLLYLCSTSGMGLVLGGRARVVLTGHADASWVDDLATQRSSQGYTFSLGSGFVSWRSTRSSSVVSSSCEAEIYAGAMAAQELRWLTYLLTDLGEAPRSPLVLSSILFRLSFSHTGLSMKFTSSTSSSSDRKELSSSSRPPDRRPSPVPLHRPPPPPPPRPRSPPQFQQPQLHPPLASPSSPSLPRPASGSSQGASSAWTSTPPVPPAIRSRTSGAVSASAPPDACCRALHAPRT
ncbi:unnamed protein product, partial [Closterium sp. NIES-54]